MASSHLFLFEVSEHLEVAVCVLQEAIDYIYDVGWPAPTARVGALNRRKIFQKRLLAVDLSVLFVLPLGWACLTIARVVTLNSLH